jgi:hypothetical protein
VNNNAPCGILREPVGFKRHVTVDGQVYQLAPLRRAEKNKALVCEVIDGLGFRMVPVFPSFTDTLLVLQPVMFLALVFHRDQFRMVQP